MDDAPRTPEPKRPNVDSALKRTFLADVSDMPWRTSRKTLVKRAVTFAGISALAAGFLMWVGIWEPEYRPEGIEAELSVPGSDFEPDDVELPEDDTEDRILEGDQPIAFPALTSVEADLASGDSVEIPELGLTLRGIGDDPPSSVRVDLTAASATDGLKWRLERTDGSSEPGTVEAVFDYSAYRNAGGADWDDRLKAYDGTGAEIPSAHNAIEGTLTTEIDLKPTGSGGGYLPTSASGAGGSHGQSASTSSVILAASASGDNGTFAATSLAPSATWSAGNPTGDFSWSYPIDTPSSVGGLDPSIAFAYSSSAVDGRNESTNNQPSTIGEGFSFDPGYIERNYTACQMDDEDSANNPPEAETGGDQCWATDNAVLSLNGSGGELVRDDETGKWKIKNDDASKVEKLSGANNGDDNGEYWKVTTGAGIQYFFGLNRLPGYGTGDAETESTSTVPVFGNHSDEPCHATAFDDSWCQQAWRWRLDWVIDPHDNAIAYFYEGESNHYLLNLDDTKPVAYDRGANLSRIDYGLRSGDAYAGAVNRVVFDLADRCLTGSTCDYDHPENWPDVPLDQYCDGTAADCEAIYSPTFFTDQRLASVTTQVYTGGTWTGVDKWSLAQSWPDPGDSTRAGLWLNGITRTGLAGGDPIALPQTTFDGIQLYNRVQKTLDTKAPMNWFRISAIRNGTGGITTVNYTDTECDAKTGVMPSSPEDNDMRCMPVIVTTAEDNGGTPEYDWYHKYVVTKVADIDATGGSPPVTTNYQYVGKPAWRYTDDDGLTDPKFKTWSEYRGYSAVRTITGDGSDEKLVTETTYFRGLHGQKLPNGDTTNVSVDGITDYDEFAGRPRAETTYLDGAAISKTVTTPWRSEPTATRVRDWATVYARHTGTSVVASSSVLADGTWRTATTTTKYDSYGMAISTESSGDAGVAGDEQCVKITYARNTSKWIVNLPVRTQTLSTTCSDTAPSYPSDLISDERVYYDYATTHTTAPTKGDITKTETAKDYANGAPVYLVTGSITVDEYGRGRTSTDVDGNVTTTVYTPATGGPVTQVTSTNTLGHSSTQILDPLRGNVKQSLDANSNLTEMQYDSLGRLIAGWTPDRTKADGYDPAAKFEYLLRNDKASATITHGINANSTYTTTIEFFDGLMRSRQTQIPAPDGGRILTDTVYDTRGLVHKQYGAYYNDAAPSTEQFFASDNDIPGMTSFEYDTAGRVTAEVFSSHGIEQYRTTTVYDGEAVTVVDPDGRAATSIVDEGGNTVEVRNLHTADPAGAFDSIRYEYDHADRLKSMTDTGGNEWTYEYDLMGRQTAVNDPDTGRTETTYYDNGLTESVTDSRGESVWYEYDELGRVLYVMKDSFDGELMEAYEYDLFGLGLPATTSSWDEADNLYKTRVLGYDKASRPVGVRYTLDGNFGALDRSFDFRYTYNRDGSVAQVTYPAAGGLAAEEVVTTYSDLGLPQTTYSPRQWYVSDSTYTKYAEIAQMTMDPDGPNVSEAPVAWQAFTYEDGTRRMTGSSFEISTGPDHVISDLTYEYTDGGLITSIDNQSNLGSDTQCFAYDYLKRITDAWTGATPATCDAEPTSKSQVGGVAPYWQSWTFDDSGNRTGQVDHLADETIGYKYEGLQPHTVTSATITNSSGTKTLSYGYDLAGNTTARPDVNGAAQALTWSHEGELETSSVAGKTTDYDYTADGTRISRTDPDGTMTVFLPGMEVVKAADGTLSASRYYTHGGSQVAIRTNDDNLSWLGADLQGTSTAAVDMDSHAVQVRYFDIYGNERGTPPASWVDQRGFLGAPEDPSGLTHLGAREYDPILGRFISADPVLNPTDSQQMGGYAYANHSPVSFSDPTGLTPGHNSNGSCIDGDCSYYQNDRDLRSKDDCQKYAGTSAACGAGRGTGAVTDEQRARADAERDIDEDLQQDAETAQDIMNLSIVDVVIDVGAEILLDLIGVNDIMSCVGAGDMMACASLLMDLIPWAKVAKLAGKLFKAAKKIYKAVTNFQEKLSWARSTLKRYNDAVEEATERARKRLSSGSGSDTPDCLSNSFTAETEVVMADGSIKPISEVEPGDQVLATDEGTGEATAREVVTGIKGTGARILVDISVDTDGDGKTDDIVTATDGHPIWAADESDLNENPESAMPGGWFDAIDLQSGQFLRTSAGTWTQITAIEVHAAFTTVYNLTVAEDHTFSVAMPGADLLTHNCGSGAVDGGGLSDDELLEAASGLRDEFAESASQLSNSKRPATVTAGYNIETRQYAAGGSFKGACAEMCVVSQLGGDPSKIRFTSAVRPRTGDQVSICMVCEARYGRSSFVQSGTTYLSDFISGFYH